MTEKTKFINFKTSLKIVKNFLSSNLRDSNFYWCVGKLTFHLLSTSWPKFRITETSRLGQETDELRNRARLKIAYLIQHINLLTGISSEIFDFIERYSLVFRRSLIRRLITLNERNFFKFLQLYNFDNFLTLIFHPCFYKKTSTLALKRLT